MKKANHDIRNASLPPMRFQKRDGDIIQTIYDHDGLLARRQIKQLFWPNTSQQAMHRRLMLLSQAGFLNMPNAKQRRIHPIPEPVVWLGWRGIIYVASQIGVAIVPPEPINENQLRRLEKRSRDACLGWHREPRWSQLGHDIAVNDFRLSVEEAVRKWPSLSLEEWIPEGDFFRDMDTVAFSGQHKKKRKKGVRPDGFFVLVDYLRKIGKSSAKARFLLELDNSTHGLARFRRDKILAGSAYIYSDVYRRRFGFNSGRWLVVCKSQPRLINLKAETEKALGNKATNFLFTTLEQVAPDTVLNKPIWELGASDKRIELIKNINQAR